MKVTVVPAQVTTVEDRIIGSLGFTQILLLVVPVFASAGIFTLAPPFLSVATYKYVLMVSVTLVFCLLAIRVKGTIVASWMATILRFNLRPKYYVFKKNTTSLREDYPVTKETQKTPEEYTRKVIEKTAGNQIDILTTSKILATLVNPEANVRYETNKKGGLHVRYTEVED